ncbi:MAG: nitrate reductase molybdenum cofactor assembly chaperone [Planctomycetota bacterium]|jgi:nitrate reductase delta subunit|nr:nitrate reductase molybdenum cofactor assembly chaperone [Planctomycetota bacterium]
MQGKERLFDSLSGLVEYPDDSFKSSVGVARNLLCQEYGQAADCLGRFAESIESCTRDELEEFYTRTFDINPDVTLEVGWHLFGEQYERGAFLVYMRDQLRSHGLKESSELPDHLTHALQLLGRLDFEHAEMFVGRALRPALKKMLESLRSKDSSYRWVFESIVTVVDSCYPDSSDSRSSQSAPTERVCDV